MNWMTNHLQGWCSRSIWAKFSKQSGNFHKLYNINVYSVQIASEGLALILQLETIENSSYQ